MVPASYRIFAEVDGENAILEADDHDNFALATNTLVIVGADLRVSSMSGAPVAFSGRPYTVSVTIENTGVADARGFVRAYYLSRDTAIRIFDQQVAVTGTATLTAGGTQTYVDTLDMPVLTATTSLYLGVIVDLYDAVPESNANNNIGRIPNPISIVFPIPNMTAEIVETATAAAAGEELAVTRLLSNDGVADSGAFEYTYYLSSNPVISTDDIMLGTFSSSLPEGGDDYAIDVVNVPSSVTPGTYYLGLIVDPEDRVDEVYEDDNATLGPQVPVYAAAIHFVTNSLPNGTLGVPYEVGVYATGGPLALTYSVAGSALPGGLALDPASGILSGTPTTEGLFHFALRASAGTAYADRSFSIRVVAPTVGLEIATPALPTAVAHRAYDVRLVAVGGTPPYEWSAISRLPSGLSVSTDGRLSGSPESPGSLPVTFRVRDALGASRSKDLALNVINANNSIQIVQVPLPTAIVGLPYCEPETVSLEARNGIAPYTWSLIGAGPPGLTLAADGSICGTPEQTGRFPITVRAQDQTGLFDTSLFILEVDDGTDLAISTFTLEPAQVGTAYAASVTAIRGVAPYTFTVVDSWGELPPGLTLGDDGMVAGTPSADGTFAFVVRVVDSQLRSDTQPLSIVVAPAPTKPVDDTGCGCSAAEGSDRPLASLFLMLVLGAVLLFRRRSARRRRRLIAAAAVAVSAGFAHEARAQFVPGTPYVMTTAPITYQPCSSPTVISTDVDDGQFPVTIPFQFRFYDDFPTSISVGANGAIAFPSGTSISLSNEAPGNSSLDAFIAPMWDDLRLYSANGGVIGTVVAGTAPNRTLTICYEGMSRFSFTGFLFSFQIRLFEGQSGRVEIDYGPTSGVATFTGTMGMEDTQGARPILFHPGGCTTACTQVELESLSNTRITVVEDPGVEIVAVGVTAPEIAFLGAQTPVQVQVANLNANPVGPFTVAVEAGDGPTVMNPVAVGSVELTLPGFTSRAVTVTSVIPSSFGERSIYLRAIADSTGAITEVNETNNVTTSATAVRLLRGKPDLSVERVVATATAGVDSGGALTVYTTVTNVGGEDAPATDVGVVLSSNPVISPQDVEIGRFTVVLAPGESVTSTETVTVPADTNSGLYYLGAVADPENTLEELSESNNGRADPTPIVVRGGELAVVTAALPNGYVSETYTALLSAVGGDGSYHWSVAQGTLPSGIGLAPATGELFGRPQVAESQNLTLRVESNGASAEHAFTLTVEDPAEPLTIVSRALAPAVVGQEYAFSLVATGGSGDPTTWSATGLPAGLALDGARIFGTPEVAGQATVALSVTNGTETATRQLPLTVREDANLLIVPMVLSTGRFSEAYETQLIATGGVPPINWLLEDGQLPKGVTLGLEGKLTGTPTEVGTFTFAVRARDSASGANNATDVNSFELQVLDVDGFSITTESLPDAVIDQGYDVTITAAGGLMPYEWTVAEGRLPDGLIANSSPMTGELRIAGRPAQTGVSNLLIQVTDSQRRRAIRALSIRVVDPITTTGGGEGGCGCTATDGRAAGGLWVSVLGLGLLLLRRRRLALLGLLGVLFTTTASAQPVPGTPYQRTVSAHTYTPLSNPTVIWSDTDDAATNLNLPFMFRYYDTNVTGDITVGANGAIVLAPGQGVSLANEAPGTSTLNNFIAPFWDDLRVYAGTESINYQIDGTAPNRTMTIEYNMISLYGNSAFHTNFQVRLFEGPSGRLQIDYGDTTGTGAPSASMGMEDAAGGRPIFFHPSMCTTACSLAEITSLANMRIDLVEDPGVEIIANAIQAPDFAFLGAQSTINVAVQNLHGTPLGPFTLQVQAGMGPTVQNPITIGTLDVTLGAFQQQLIPVPAVFPQSLGETSVYLRFTADSGNAVTEVDETNNTVVSTTPTRLLRGRADLAVQSVRTDVRAVSANGALTIYSTVRNIGGEPANNVAVAAILSSNPVISPQDLELERFSVTLAPGETINSTTTVSLAGVNSGVYYAGVLADPDRMLDELSEANNGLAAFYPITVTGGTLAITTTALPTAYVRQSYTALLAAVGGDQAYHWELTQGMWPAGIGLVPNTGELFGRPSVQETQTITVRCTSGSQTDEATFTLVVSDPDEPLTIVTRAVPAAVIGQEYSFRLIATGGSETSSLAWSATGLPDGMAMSSDGVLAGSVSLASSSTISVMVTDGTETAMRDILFEVGQNVNLLIVPAVLSTAHYNEAYSTKLTASGGLPPITWLRQLGTLPEGVGLSADGTLSGTPLQVGTFRFVVEARDSGSGGLAAKDVNSFELEVVDMAGGFTISTTEIPKAIVDTGYEATISATGGLPPYEWSIEAGRLPEGMVPSFDATTNAFRISGSVGAPGVTNLLISVVDAQGRSAQRAFALVVEEAPAMIDENADGGGCGCTAARTSGRSVWSGIGLFALALLALRRRRRTSSPRVR